MNSCSSCRFWCRGIITVFSREAIDWEGKLHPNHGQTTITRPYQDIHTVGQDIGTCGIARGENKLVIAVGDGTYGELITDASFGCTLYEVSDSNWDHYQRTTFSGRKLKS